MSTLIGQFLSTSSPWRWWLSTPGLLASLFNAVIVALAHQLTRLRSAFQTDRDQNSRMSADAAPTLFPNRPIRPLPKRRLRERLSLEVAESIEYPPVPQSISPLFSYNIPSIDESVSSGTGTGSALPREVVADLARQTRGIGLGPENDRAGNSAPRTNISNRPQLDTSGRLLSSPPTLDQDEFPPLSYPSSPDGYDSFENANNKKKRKIPTAVEGGVHISNESLLSAGPLNRPGQAIEAHGQSSTPSSSPYYSPYYGPGGFGSGAQNVAGPGRGRYGRTKSGRSPLRPLSDSTNSRAGRNSKLRPRPWTPGSSKFKARIVRLRAIVDIIPRRESRNHLHSDCKRRETHSPPRPREYQPLASATKHETE